MIETNLKPLTIIHKSLSLQGQLHPHFDAKVWLQHSYVQDGAWKCKNGLLASQRIFSV
jgi:hypothetical protein